MAGVAFSGLTALGAAPVSADFFVGLDTSDTTQGANGTVKKIAHAHVLDMVELNANVFAAAQTILTGNGDQLALDNTGQQYTQITFKNNSVIKSLIAWNNTLAAMTVGSHLAPETTDAYALGIATNEWADIYCDNGTIITSDESEKTEIDDSDLGLDFVMALRPIRYRRLQGKRPHYGLGARQVQAAMQELGVADFAGLIINTDDDGNQHYALRYTEFIAPMVATIQELVRRGRQLKQRVDDLESRIAALEAA